MTRVGAYTPNTARRILEVVNRLDASVADDSKIHVQQGFLFKTPAGGIPVDDKAECEQQFFDENDTLIPMFDGSGTNTRDVHNIFPSDIGGDRLIVALSMYGRLVCIAEACPGA